MKTTEKNTEKRMYNSPEVVRVELDNEVSLTLDSAPPAGPGEPTVYAPEYMKSNPFRHNLS